MEFIFFSSGGHPQGKKTIRTQRNWSTSKNSVSLFPFAAVCIHHFFSLLKKTIKEDRQYWESNRRLIAARKMSTNFTDQPQGICGPWWGEKDARISAQNISVLSIMASWSEWWWHLVSALAALRAFWCAHKTKWGSQCWWMCGRVSLLYMLHVKVAVVNGGALSLWDRQVSTPDYWHQWGHDTSTHWRDNNIYTEWCTRCSGMDAPCATEETNYCAT